MQGSKDFCVGGGMLVNIYFANLSHFQPLKRVKVWFMIEILKFNIVDTFKQGGHPEFCFI